jgi:hypothetical protein
VELGPDGPIVRTGDGFIRMEESEGISLLAMKPGDVLGVKIL